MYLIRNCIIVENKIDFLLIYGMFTPCTSKCVRESGESKDGCQGQSLDSCYIYTRIKH